MKVRIPALLAAVTLIAVACGGTTASPSASTAASVAPPPSTAASEAPSTAPSAAAGPTTLRVSRISDFLPSIHPVELGTGNQELMADIVFSTLVDVDKDEVTILPDLAQTWDGHPRRDDLHVPPEPGRRLERWPAGHRRRRPVDDRLVRPEPGRVQADPGLGVPRGQGRRRRQGHDEHARRRREDRRPHRQAHAGGAGLDLPPPPRRRGLLHPAEAHAGRPDRRAGGDLPVLPGHRRRDDRLRPVRLLRVDLGRWRDVQGQEELLEGQGLADRYPGLQDPGIERVRRPARRG